MMILAEDTEHFVLRSRFGIGPSCRLFKVMCHAGQKMRKTAMREPLTWRKTLTCLVAAAFLIAAGAIGCISLLSTAAAAHGGHGGGGHGGGGHGGGGHGGGGHGGWGHFGGGHHFGGHGWGHHFGGMGHGWGHHFGGMGHGWGHHGHFAGRHFLGAHGHFAGHGGHNQFAHNRSTHNQLSGLHQHFHGLNHFNHNGFNRNAFGNRAAWNHWGRNNWGPGWNDWGTGWGYWAGPIFWPFFYGDLLTCGFWPYGHYCPFWGYGPKFVLASIFWPGPFYGTYYGDYGYREFDIYGSGGYGHAVSRRYHATPLTNQTAQTEQRQEESCTGLAPDVTDLPVDRIEHIVHPTGDQMGSLDALKSASSTAKDALKASCPNEVALTPVGRLDAMQKRLNSMVQAIAIVRTPLENFYNSLDDEQRQRFNAIGGTKSAGPSNGLGALCGQESESFTQLPLQRIEQSIQPNQQQQAALDDLKTASSSAANELQKSCPTETPGTPGDRLDAMTKRLDAMIQATKTVRPALNNFYASLSDEQKSRFNVMGPQGRSLTQTGAE
jgi:LTXXQ motif family protein